MSKRLLKCSYGCDENGYDVCQVECCGEEKAVRCAVYDGEGCPFGKRVEGCGTCAHVGAMSEDDGGLRIVDCELNELQMYAPYATECKHWERALG